MQDTRTTLIIAVVANAANLLIELLFVYGLDLGHRRLGVGHGDRAVRRRVRVPRDRRPHGARRGRVGAARTRPGSAPNATVGSRLVVRTASLIVALAHRDGHRRAHQRRRGRRAPDLHAGLPVPRPLPRRARDRRPGDGRALPRRDQRARRPGRRPAPARARHRRRRAVRARGDRRSGRGWSGSSRTTPASGTSRSRSSGSSPRSSRSRRWCSCSTACSSAPVTPATSRWAMLVATVGVYLPAALLVAVLDGGLLWLWGALVAAGCWPGSWAWPPASAPSRLGGRRRGPPAPDLPAQEAADAVRAARRVATFCGCPHRQTSPLPTSSAPRSDRPSASRRSAVPGRATTPPERRARSGSTPGVAASRCGRSPGPSTTRSTATGCAPSGRGSSTCPWRVARCSSATTAAPSPPTPRSSCTASSASCCGRSTGSPRTSSAPCRCSARCGRAPVACPRTRTTRTACCTTTSQLVLVFPEGTKATGKLVRDRYQLRRFGRGGFVEIAMRAGVPVVPMAIIGNEEAMPILWKSARLAKLVGLPYFPITANQFVFGPVLGYVMPLPAKFRIRVLPPVHVRRPARPGPLQPRRRDGGGRAHPRAHPDRGRRHAARASQHLARLSARARPRHRPRHLLGQPHRADARGAPRGRAGRRGRHARTPAPPRTHRVREGRRRRTASSSAWCAPPRSTPSCTPTSRSTPPGPAAAGCTRST